MRISYEQVVGLEPLPDGLIVAMENPFRKTVYFERATDFGPEPCERPDDYKLKDGWRIVRHPKS